MSHSAELSRRMAKARISACHTSRASDSRFERTEPEHLKRVPWESETTGLPWATNWFAVWDGIIFALCLVGIGLVLTGVIA